MASNSYQHFGVVGAGSFGTALAIALRRAGRDVTIWSHNPQGATDINEQHENRRHLPGITLDPAIKATSDLATAGTADCILFATPAQNLRAIAKDFRALRNNAPVIIGTKGIELGTLKLMSEVVAEEMPGRGIAILSGPSFAAEVATGKPTALTLAAKDEALSAALRDTVASKYLRVYSSDDVIGVQIGGAVKNVMAIACGIITGRSFGESARAALITRGLAEMIRLGASLGARAETLMGLSGLGDLILTCSSLQSRNMSLGKELGEGKTLDQILAARNSVAEGVPTAAAALALAKKHSVEMPIVAEVASVLQGATSIDKAINDLMSRPFKIEAH
jgi:glycerol-3-phosphate dehydrogenase (NAD(P)+)